jgi:hypothetical protein
MFGAYFCIWCFLFVFGAYFFINLRPVVFFVRSFTVYSNLLMGNLGPPSAPIRGAFRTRHALQALLSVATVVPADAFAAFSSGKPSGHDLELNIAISCLCTQSSTGPAGHPLRLQKGLPHEARTCRNVRRCLSSPGAAGVGLQMLDESSQRPLSPVSRSETLAKRRGQKNVKSGTFTRGNISVESDKLTTKRNALSATEEISKESRLPDWVIEISVVMAGIMVGIATGAAVKLFRYAVLQLKSFTYAGPWFQMVSCIKANTAPHMPSALAGVKPELVLLPFLGGLITWALIKMSRRITGNAPGPALAGHLEDLQMGKDADYRRVGFRKLGMVAALGTGNSLGPVRCQAQ